MLICKSCLRGMGRSFLIGLIALNPARAEWANAIWQNVEFQTLVEVEDSLLNSCTV